MEKELTPEEKIVREISEKNNPYAPECPNKHLWSEGFRAGYRYAIGICDFADAILKKPEEIPEISDEEIEQYINSHPGNLNHLLLDKVVDSGFKVGTKWYREELKKRIKIND